MLLIVLVIIALAAPFFIKGQDGRPLMTLEDIQKPDALESYAESFGEMSGSVTGENQEAGKSAARVYSWRDEQGNVHYSNVPPKEATAVETVKVNPDINVISVDKNNEQARLPVPPPPIDDDATDADPGMIRTYAPGQ